MIAFYIIGSVLMVIAQYCFMFKIWFNVELIGSLSFLGSLLLIIPSGIIGGWNKIWIYLLCLAGSFLVGLISSSLLFRYVFKNHFSEKSRGADITNQHSPLANENKKDATVDTEIRITWETIEKQVLESKNIQFEIDNKLEEQHLNNKSQNEAISILTNKVRKILLLNDFFKIDGHMYIIPVIEKKEEFADAFCPWVINFRRKFYYDLEYEICDDSIESAFYGAIYITLRYYQHPDNFNNFDSLEYLKREFQLYYYHDKWKVFDDLKEFVKLELDLLGSTDQSQQMRSIIKPIVDCVLAIREEMDSFAEYEIVLRIATEYAYVLGMLFAMNYYHQEKETNFDSTLKCALQKLVASAKDSITPRTNSMS